MEEEISIVATSARLSGGDFTVTAADSLTMSEIVDDDATKAEEDNSPSGTQTLAPPTAALTNSLESPFVSATTSAIAPDLTSTTSKNGIDPTLSDKNESQAWKWNPRCCVIHFFTNVSYWIVLHPVNLNWRRICFEVSNISSVLCSRNHQIAKSYNIRKLLQVETDFLQWNSSGV